MTHSTSSRNPGENNRIQAHSAAARIQNRVRRSGARFFAVLFWLIVWQAASMIIGQELLLVSPVKAAGTLLSMMGTAEFYLSVAGSLFRILAGFALGAVLGAALAALAYAARPVDELLAPLMYAIKATPVASFVILALIFISSRHLSVLMSFLMVLPLIYTNVLTGLKHTDRRLIEMARVFHMSMGARIRGIYVPAAYPHFLSACALALGLSWKAGIAAEVIGLPDRSIGEALYQAKIFFSTPELFAWTLAIILLSVALEQAVMRGVKALSGRLEGNKS